MRKLKEIFASHFLTNSLLIIFLTIFIIILAANLDFITSFIVKNNTAIMTAALIILLSALIFQKKQNDIMKENEKLYQEIAEKQKHIDRDLKMAQTIQTGILNQPLDTSDKFDIAARCQPAREIGGDFFGTQKNDSLLNIFVGDVSGHGISSALLMSLTDGLLHEICSKEEDIEKILSKVNRLLFRYLQDNINFVTLFLGQIDLQTMKLNYITAGQHPALLFSGQGTEPQRLESKGSILGTYGDAVFKKQEITLKKDDRLVIYTDGFLETNLRTKEMLGEKGVIKLLQKYIQHSPQKIIDTLYQDIASIAEEQKDDLTILISHCR